MFVWKICGQLVCNSHLWELSGWRVPCRAAALGAASTSASAWRMLLGIHLVLCTPVLRCCRLLAGPAASAGRAGRPTHAPTTQALTVFFQHWPHIGIPTFPSKGVSLSQCIKKTMTACMLSCITMIYAHVFVRRRRFCRKHKTSGTATHECSTVKNIDTPFLQ